MNKYAKTPAWLIGQMHPLRNALLWASKAVSDEETRYVLNHVLIERDGMITRMVATDGKRCHVAEYDAGMFDTDIAKDVPDAGLYEVHKLKQALVICEAEELSADNYPDWRQVVPKVKETSCESVGEKTLSKVCMITGALLASDFLADAVGCDVIKGDVMVTLSQPEPLGGVVIRHELGYAVVMPYRYAKGAESEKDATASLPGIPEAKIPESKPDSKKESNLPMEEADATVIDGRKKGKK